MFLKRGTIASPEETKSITIELAKVPVSAKLLLSHIYQFIFFLDNINSISY